MILAENLRIKRQRRNGSSMGMIPIGSSPGAAVAAANKWRDQLNPTRGLTMAKVTRLLEAGQRGEFADLQWAFKFAEKRNAIARAVIKRIISAIDKRAWDIQLMEEDDLPPGATMAQAQAQADFLNSLYGEVDNLKEVLRHLALAEFRGFAHCWPRQNESGVVDHMECLDQWNFVRDGSNGAWAFNPEARQTTFDHISENEINRPDWVIREVMMPIDEIVLIELVRKSLGRKDFAAWIEIYGLPSWAITMGENTSPEQAREYLSKANDVASGGNLALPPGSEAKPNSAPDGTAPFTDFIRESNEEVVMAATGGLLTVMTESGSGTLAGGAHEETFEQIADSESGQIEEVLQRDFDKPRLMASFPGQRVLAWFKLSGNRDAGKIAETVAKLKTAGFQADAEEMSEKTGLTLTVAPEPTALDSFSALARNRVGQPMSEPSTSPLMRATAKDLRPIVQRLRDIESMTDPASQKKALEAMLAAYGKLAKEVLANSESSAEWEKLLGTEMVNGMI